MADIFTSSPPRIERDQNIVFVGTPVAFVDNTGVWGQDPVGSISRRPNKILVGTGGIMSSGPITGSGTAFDIDGAAGTNRDLMYTTSGANRWILRTNSTAESGANAGSDFNILARADNGNAIDTPLTIVRAAGGAATWVRPVVISLGAITAAALVESQSVTWNNAAVVFTAVQLAITDTASDLRSLRKLVTVGGVTREAAVKGSFDVHQYSDPGNTVFGDGNDYVGSGSGASLDLNAVTGAYHNCFFGGESGGLVTTGHQNTFLGNRSGVNTSTGNQNTFVGQGAGYQALITAQMVCLGYHAGLNALGDTNTFIGSAAGTGVLGTSTGTGNVGVGQNSLFAFTTGVDNLVTGTQAAFSLTTGNQNVIVGTRAAYGAAGVGALTTGNNNVIIGYQALPSAVGVSNEITLGTSTHTFTRLGLGGPVSVTGFAPAAVTVVVGQSPYTPLGTDYEIRGNTAGGAITVALPTAASFTGRQLIIKNITATAAVTVTANGAETIDGAASIVLPVQWQTLEIQSNGVSWDIQ